MPAPLSQQGVLLPHPQCSTTQCGEHVQFSKTTNANTHDIRTEVFPFSQRDVALVLALYYISLLDWEIHMHNMYKLYNIYHDQNRPNIQISLTQIILLGEQLPLVNQHTRLINRQTRLNTKHTSKIERIAGIQHPLPFHQDDLLSPLFPSKQETHNTKH